MDQWIKTYGKVFGIFMAEKPYLVITDVDIVRQIFLKEANQFQDRSEFALDVEPLTSSLMLLRGERFACLLPLFVRPLFPSLSWKCHQPLEEVALKCSHLNNVCMSLLFLLFSLPPLGPFEGELVSEDHFRPLYERGQLHSFQ